MLLKFLVPIKHRLPSRVNEELKSGAIRPKAEVRGAETPTHVAHPHGSPSRVHLCTTSAAAAVASMFVFHGVGGVRVLRPRCPCRCLCGWL